MCGISGSKNKDKAFELYKINLNRGYYSSGALVLDSHSLYHSYKVLGLFDRPVDVPNEALVEAQYFLYHSRGPTVETKNFVPVDNHPFFYGNWIVAHNGIISNFKDLSKKYFPEDDLSRSTDSCIIPRIFETQNSISEALQLLRGTFAIWAYNSVTKKIYLARSGSTLFANDAGDFSSTEFENSKSLNEGMIYTIDNYNCLISNGRFKYKSPYFII